MKKIELLGLQTVPEIQPGDNLAEIIFKAAVDEIGGLRDRDVVVITSKIVSKAEGRLRKVDEVVPGKRALAIAGKTGKDPRWVQMILDEEHEILAIIALKGIIAEHVFGASADSPAARQLLTRKPALCITRDSRGRIHTCEAGIDSSNHPAGTVSLLPGEPDEAARDIRQQLQGLCGKEVAVILADTEIIPFGTMDLALGSSGISPLAREFGQKDRYERPKFGGMDLVANELASASALLFGQGPAGIPVAVVRGYSYQISESENIANTLPTQAGRRKVAEAIRETIRATACARPFRQRLLLKIASWFI